jgi:arginase family enzyme
VRKTDYPIAGRRQQLIVTPKSDPRGCARGQHHRRDGVAPNIADHAGAIPIILGGDRTIAWPDHTGVARHLGFGNVSMIHFDAHADTGDIQLGSLIAHGTPMRRLIESGALRGDRFLQMGLRGYWPDEPILEWMAARGLRSYEMTEIVTRGLETCLSEAFTIATDDCEGVFLSVDIDVCDPGHAPGTGTPEPGGFSARQLLDAVRRICYELPVVGVDIVEVSPPFDHADITALLGNRVVLEAISAIARRRKDHATGTTWDPSQPLLEGRDVDEQLRLIAEGEEARRQGDVPPLPHQHH